ncbi:hypothetical protein KAT51_01755, partial [bacterium]|nr:hypothetical protein [bacterium]
MRISKRIILIFILIVLSASLLLFKKSTLEKKLEEGERFSFLIIGLEERERPQSLKDLLLVSYQPKTKRLSLVVIPTNTLISDNTKIKNLYRQSLRENGLKGGCLAVKESLEKFLNLKVPIYLIFDEEGFIKV